MSKSRLVNVVFLVMLAAVILIFVLAWLRPPVYREAEIAAELAQIRTELPLARARWASQNITSYDITVVGGVSLICFFEATLQVREGKLATVVERDSEGEPVTRPFRDSTYCSFQMLLVPEMFKRVEESLAQIDPAETYLTVEFDPVYGYVTEYQTGCIQATDCGSGFAFRDFRLLPNPGE